jgi:GTPase Era involved in 16S rRNA processing
LGERRRISFSLVRKLDCPVFLVLTKIDLVRKDQLLPLIDRSRSSTTLRR